MVMTRLRKFIKSNIELSNKKSSENEIQDESGRNDQESVDLRVFDLNNWRNRETQELDVRDDDEDERIAQLQEDQAAAAAAQAQISNRSSAPPQRSRQFLLSPAQSSTMASSTFARSQPDPVHPSPVSSASSSASTVQRSFRGNRQQLSGSSDNFSSPTSVISPNLFYALNNEKERQNHLYFLMFEIYKAVNSNANENIP
jgi:hypothetical protein